MKKSFILLPLIGVFAYVIFSSNSGGPGIDHTGATAGSAGCGPSGCHNPTAVPAITILAELYNGATPVTSYTPLGSYTIRLTGTNTTAITLSHFGFQVSAVKATTTTNAGTLTPIASSHSSSLSGVTVIEHSSPFAATTLGGATGGTYVVNIPWTAPAAGTGSVALNGVVNAVNYNFGADAGDKWNYTITPVIITESSSTTVGTIAGTKTVCMGATTTLTCTPASGTWSSSTTATATVGSSTGIVTGVAAGTATITYNAGTAGTATAVVTVNAVGAAPIAGANHVCLVSSPTTTLTNLTPGGTWSSSNITKAIVGSTTGLVTGVAAGTTIISYTATNSCGTSTTTLNMTVYASGSCPTGVNPVPNAPATSLDVYPNPNNGAFTLNMHSDFYEDANVIVCGISGEKVKEFTIATNTAVDIRIPHVAGMYFVSVTTAHGNYITRLLIQ